MPSSAAERMRLKRQRDLDDPDRKFRKLDSIYMFEEVDVSIIIDHDQNIWFKAVDLTRALEMKDPYESVYQQIDKKYCQKYKTLSSSIPKYRNIPGMNPQTTFVNETGMKLFISKSVKPKAKFFKEWINGFVLPSLCKNDTSKVDPLKEMNDIFKKQAEDLQVRNTHLENKNTNLENKIVHLENKISSLENENKSLVNDVRKYAQQLFEMKPSCVPPLKNKVKEEYFVLYRKYKPNNIPLDEKMPYYACRVQLDSLEQRRLELLEEYPDLDKLLQLLVPNSVVFFNYVLEKMPNFLKRETRGQSFCIKDISENEMLTMIQNLYRTLHGMDPFKKQ